MLWLWVFSWDTSFSVAPVQLRKQSRVVLWFPQCRLRAGLCLRTVRSEVCLYVDLVPRRSSFLPKPSLYEMRVPVAVVPPCRAWSWHRLCSSALEAKAKRLSRV